MKLCEKCVVAIKQATSLVTTATNRFYVPPVYDLYSFVPVQESECEFPLHKQFNSIVEFVKWCTVCGKPTDSNTVKCECGAEHQWSGLPFWR